MKIKRTIFSRISVIWIVLLITFSISAISINGTASDEDVPKPPPELVITPCGEEVGLVWHHPEDNEVDRFLIFRGTSRGNESFYAMVEGDKHYYKDLNTDKFQEYFYYIVSVKGNRFSEPSKVVRTVRECGVDRPPSPQNLTWEKDNGTVILRWDQSQMDIGYEVSYYRIYRAEDGGKLELYERVFAPERTFMDGNITDDGIYNYSVSAVNRLGASELSMNLTVQINEQMDKSGAGLEKDECCEESYSGMYFVLIDLVILSAVFIMFTKRR